MHSQPKANTSHILFPLFLTRYPCPHFSDEETGASVSKQHTVSLVNNILSFLSK